MEKHIELYLKPDQSCDLQRLCYGRHRILSTNESLSPAEENVKNTIENLCKEKFFQLQIYDINSKLGKQKAKARGVLDSSVVAYDSSAKKWKIMHIINDLTREDLTAFIHGRESPAHTKRSHIELQELDGKTIIDLPEFSCSDCGGHGFKILKDYSGFCAECGKAYMEIKKSR